MIVILQPFEVLKKLTCNPSTLQRIEGLHAILQMVEGFHSKSFEGLKHCMWHCMHSFEGLNCFNPFGMIWRVKGFYTILGGIEGSHSKSFEVSNGCKQSFNPWMNVSAMLQVWRINFKMLKSAEGLHSQSCEGFKDNICNLSKGWRIASEIVRNLSNGWRTAVFLQSVEGLKVSMKCLEELEDCMQCFDPWRIDYVILERVEGLCGILQTVIGLNVTSHAMLRRVEWL